MNYVLNRKLIYRVSKPFPFKLIRRLTKQYFIFPFYHLVSDAPSPLVKHLYPVVSVNQFNKDIDFLLEYFSAATFDEVLELAKNKTYTGKPKFFLTFDDGFSECYDVVLPILKERNLPAAFFINPAFVGNHNLSHRQRISLIIDYLFNCTKAELIKEAEHITGKKFQHQAELIGFIKKFTIADSVMLNQIATVFNIDFKYALQHFKPYMNTSQLRELKHAGFHIGSHSYDHPEFSLLSQEKMKEQVIDSFQFLKQELRINDSIFSFPFHDIGVPLSFFEFLRKEAGVKASFGTSGIKYDNAPGHIHRIPMEMNGFEGAESIIRSEYFYYLGKAPVGKNVVKRK